MLLPFLVIANDKVSKNATNKQELIWFVEDKAENKHLLDENYEISSPSTYIERLIITSLQKYNIIVKRSSSSRISQSIKDQNNVCTANRANTKARRAYSLFSSPQSFYLTHKLYRYKGKRPLSHALLNEKGQIKSLSHIFKVYPNHTIGIAKGVSFGEFLDKQISKLEHEDIYYLGGTNRVTALESMLYSERFDFLLALPIDMEPTEKQKQQLEYYPIAGAPPYLIAHINCSNSDLGKKAIQDINLILEQLYQSPKYYKAHQKWFSEKELSLLQLYLKQRFTDKTYISKD
ncbi:hypothetical protein KO527_24805 [Pseudoalteromonas sp. C2R02]|uniref:transporter substrate-binding domain-containing protein n=1 Tax=Pseudoalteromonas sp. C2R02 TaxID=2841565 RepID=UPI001C08D356|nr:transporter substrate-binding domain-containing protein [Pseudoalteromonas sp. C2R02]MBU2972559.1 hypothetical protein [Pseudoalteromonas sp. C2R02]